MWLFIALSAILTLFGVIVWIRHVLPLIPLILPSRELYRLISLCAELRPGDEISFELPNDPDDEEIEALQKRLNMAFASDERVYNFIVSGKSIVIVCEDPREPSRFELPI